MTVQRAPRSPRHAHPRPGARPHASVRVRPPATGSARRRVRAHDLPWRTLAATAALLAIALLLAIILATQSWAPGHLSPLAAAVLGLDLVSGPLPVVVFGIAAAAATALLALALAARSPARPPSPLPAQLPAQLPLQPRSRARLLATAIGLSAGAALGAGLAWTLSASNAFGVALDLTTTVWATATFAAIGVAVASLWRSAAWRRLLAVVAIIAFAAAGYVGINADFGLDRTVADVAGISTRTTLTLPVVTPRPTPVPTLLAGGALWANWHAPAGMPMAGAQAQVVIPNTLSGFKARPAGLYLPPAALTPNPPALPLVIMMMGQPGNPDPSFSAAVLDRFAAQHEGLAPIVLVADQIGNPSVDTLCLDTARHGKSETYITRDVVAWARLHLHVLQDAAHWTIAGYSNGGECALSFGVKYPQIWGNVLDISGEQYPGADRPAATLASDFGGSRAAYDAAKPLNELAGRQYPDTCGIFTVGSNDGGYRTQAKAVYAATTAAGWKTIYFEVLNGGHVLGALNGGLQEGYTVLYPRLGLAPPAAP